MASYRIILKSGAEITLRAHHIDFPDYPDGFLDIWARDDTRNNTHRILASEVAAIIEGEVA